MTFGLCNQACTIDGCQYVYDSKQEIGHLFKVHGIKSVWKLYVGIFVALSDSFDVIGLRFVGITWCDLKWIVLEFDIMDADDLSSHVGAQKSRRHVVESPVVQLSGPSEPIVLIGKGSSHHPLGIGHSSRTTLHQRKLYML